ncbi:Hsp70 family protein [Sphingomonas hankookensis]|uniref:Hsp70 family protein n=1 Tax=Sphingomonas hankookensis TaxID=563996 RepID=UPI00234F5302|nr:molecular chaperone HscC [Sphingomonas hankookensis]WCP72942.1 molecular chaperone HscC [Sphingomonas hankookensis]
MIVGIDLGTTNSACAVWQGDQPVMVPNALGEFLTPSAVSIGDDDAVLVGRAARDRMATHPDRTVTSFKRRIGTRETARLAKRDFDSEALSALVLASLKRDAEAFTGETVTGAVVTVPAYFNDRQRKATRRAGDLAGLPIKRLINEPTAAALAYGIADRGDREPFLVFDLGGGTFDVSIVEMFDGVIEVRASAGDNRLGGDDFNDCLIDLARPVLDPDGVLGKLPPDRSAALLAQAAERCRRALSEADEAELTVTVDDTALTAPVTAAAFEEHAAGLLARIREPVLRSLRDSGIVAATLSEVVLVGGATRMPVVRRAVTRMFGRFPAATVHPDHAVAMGAAVQAGLLARDAGLDEIRLTDVCPFTLGVDTSEPDGRGGFRNGLFSPIIERNSAVPISRVSSFSTVVDQQRKVNFGIYQGEAREVSGNVKLGEVTVPVPPRAAGTVSIECRFSYDSSGLLEVDIAVPETGMTRNLVIVDDEDAPDPVELEKRRAALAALKVHPRDDAVNAALLARARRAYEAFLGDTRAAIGHMLGQFESTLATQDERMIAQARAAFGAALDQIEGERFL